MADVKGVTVTITGPRSSGKTALRKLVTNLLINEGLWVQHGLTGLVETFTVSGEIKTKTSP